MLILAFLALAVLVVRLILAAFASLRSLPRSNADWVWY